MTETTHKKCLITAAAELASLPLSSERAEALVPAAERLNKTAAWLDTLDLSHIEPAVVFNPLEEE